MSLQSKTLLKFRYENMKLDHAVNFFSVAQFHKAINCRPDLVFNSSLEQVEDTPYVSLFSNYLILKEKCSF